MGVDEGRSVEAIASGPSDLEAGVGFAHRAINSCLRPVAFDLYPGQIFRGRVDSIWKANGSGQYLPSDEIPKFHPLAPDIPQGQYAVKILLDDSDRSKFPLGAQASAAIYTNGDTGAWAALRKISIRAHSWFNWLYPMPF